MAQTQDVAQLIRNLKRLAEKAPAQDKRKPEVAAQRTEAASHVEQGVNAIMEMLREFAGFRSSPQLYRKLVKVFRNSSTSEIQQWIAQTRTQHGREQLAALVEDLTNHETYFFRDPGQLQPLRETILPELIRERRRKGPKRLRLWSAATATGEEAYTLAMLAVDALSQAGLVRHGSRSGFSLLEGWSVEVIGTDISRQAVRIGREAAYCNEGLGSFRNFPEAFERYVTTVPCRQIKQRFRSPVPDLRRLVRIERGNLLDSALPCRDADVVLCRNVLIYIDHQWHKAIQKRLAEALRPGGLLVASPVDRMLARDEFQERRLGSCILYEKKGKR